MSLRDVEDLLAERSIIVSYETIRKWVSKYGKRYANAIRRDRLTPSDKWLTLGQTRLPCRTMSG